MLGSGTLSTLVLGSSTTTAAGVVDLRAARTAEIVTVGRTTAAFEKPSPSASFEQADALVIR